MPINATKTVRELAVEMPNATRLFEKLGIDYCCGGGQSLEAACSARKLPVDEVIRSLEEAERAPRQARPDTDWNRAPLNQLTAYIVEKHHGFVREETPRLEQLLANVCSVHGQNHPELLRVQAAFAELAAELSSHMFKEENVLFPYIDILQQAVDRGQPAPPPSFGTVRNPVQMMMLEHDNAGAKLREMREASSNFAAPADACVSYQTLYRALPEFEQDLHQHIHLENNILFPRAVQMESGR